MYKSVASALLLASTPAFATDVLLIHAVPIPGYATDVVSKISATGRFSVVDSWNGAASTPTLPDLLSYDAVMIMPDSYFADGAALGTVLAQYVDVGGGVVDSVFSVNWGSLYVSNAWFTDGYRPFEGNTQSNITGSLVPVTPHPLLSGVSNFSFEAFGYYGNDAVMRPGALLVANWTDGVPLLAAWQPTGAGVVVGLNAYMPSTDIAGFGWNPAVSDGGTLMANALEFAATGTIGLTAYTTGTCPGPTTIGVANATPGGSVAFVTGTPGGAFVVPSGPCAGTVLPLGAPALRTTRTANGSGAITLPAVLAAPFCGVSWVAVDLSACTVSNVDTL
jgi:hypothetical protein